MRKEHGPRLSALYLGENKLVWTTVSDREKPSLAHGPIIYFGGKENETV